MKPPWQLPWPCTMSSRTVMVSTARPGATLSMRMPSPWLALSRENMASAQASASCWGLSLDSGMEGLLGQGLAAQQEGGAIALLAVALPQVGQGAVDEGQAQLIGPGQGPPGVVDAGLHGEIAVLGAADALKHGVGGFVGEHGHRSQYHQAGGVGEPGGVQAQALEERGGLLAGLGVDPGARSQGDGAEIGRASCRERV